ncbi:MAG TPA: HD domain-containing phosphohydrolase [Geobacteraceae bacterium]
MGNDINARRKRNRIAILAMSVALVSLFHFIVPTAPHTYHKIHILLRKLYFLPPVVAAAWFGLRGALFTTAAISAIFTSHAILDWPGNYMEQANQLGELVGFWVVGLVPGYLFDRQRSLLVSLARANEETLLALVSALDMREKNTRLHSQRVRDYTLLLADRYGATEEEKRMIGFGALLHDVGKIAVSDNILLKPSALSENDWEEMRRHPQEGYRLLQRIDFLRDSAEIVYAHHEHYDGTGYPRGLKKDEIPLGARLFMVADVFDAVTSERPYHVPMSYNEAMAVIHDKSGTHFDPAVVEAFENIQSSELEAIRKRYSDKKEKLTDRL